MTSPFKIVSKHIKYTRLNLTKNIKDIHQKYANIKTKRTAVNGKMYVNEMEAFSLSK